MSGCATPIVQTKPHALESDPIGEDLAGKSWVGLVVGGIVASSGMWMWTSAPGGTGLSIVWGRWLAGAGAMAVVTFLILPGILKAFSRIIQRPMRRVEFYDIGIRIAYDQGGSRGHDWQDLTSFTHDQSTMTLVFEGDQVVVIEAFSFRDREGYERAIKVVNKHTAKSKTSSLRAA